MRDYIEFWNDKYKNGVHTVHGDARDHEFLTDLGEQIRSCVYRPGKRLRNYIEACWDDADLDSIEIFNVERHYEGLEDLWVGYSFCMTFKIKPHECWCEGMF